jgi:hypothetical protein
VRLGSARMESEPEDPWAINEGFRRVVQTARRPNETGHAAPGQSAIASGAITPSSGGAARKARSAAARAIRPS